MTEFGLIEYVAKLFGDVERQEWEAIGDDCTVLPIGGGEVLVMTTDMLQEDVHFLRSATSARELGRKSLAVNLSDVAAMGVKPVATLLSIALPQDLTDEWAKEFLEGFHSLAKEHSVALVGGDTTSSRAGVSINVVAIGRGEAQRVKRRSAAQVGDVIYVAGELGVSALGLRDIFSGDVESDFAAQHRNPRPQVEEGVWLGARQEVHAMMDLSDGLASDLCHILKLSNCGAEIDVDAIPAVQGDVEAAVCGGEDYKLLFTVEESSAEAFERDFQLKFQYPVYRIGRVVASAEPTIQWFKDGDNITPSWRGFSHF
ncbi:MAG: thiamine-phosphate kinase [Alistipes sp.]|nr:thiamine-phosphate kinase [Alistipes sp.]